MAGSATLTLAGSIVGAALSMTNEVIAAHFLGVGMYGSYGLALMLAKIGEIVALFGVPLGVLHFLPVHISQLQSRLALGVVLGGVMLPFAAGLGFTLIAGLGHDWIARYAFNLPQASGYIAVLACAIPLMTLNESLGSIARGLGRFAPPVVIRNLVPPLCYMPVLVVLLLLDGPKIGAAYGYTAGAAVGATVGLIWIFKLVRTHIGFVKPMIRSWSLYKYSAPIALNTIVTMAFIWVDLLLLASLTDGRSVSLYRGCTQIVFAFDLILSACSSAAAPLYAVMLANGQRQRLQDTVTAATRFATILAAPLMLVVLVNSSDIVGLFGREFRAGSLALSILAVGQFTKVVFGSAGIALIICGKQSIETRNIAIAACLNLVLNLLFIPWLGIQGAAIATSLSLVALSALRAWQLWASLGLRVFDGMLARVLLVSIPVAGLFWAATLVFGFGPGTGLAHLAFRLIVMGVLICAGLWLFCLGKNDRAALITTIAYRGEAARQQA